MHPHRLKSWFLTVAALAAAVAIAVFAPGSQDSQYHQFADQRTLFGIPNFWDVVTNLPFLAVGVAGCWLVLRGNAPGVLPNLRTAYLLFFAGVALVAAGSAYYHWAPDPKTLVWDRLPMTIAFTSIFVVILEEHLGQGARWLWPMVAGGLASVVYWAVTDDIRWYAIVQFLPVVLVPLILWLYPSRTGNTRYFWALAFCYVAAKALEMNDRECFERFGFLSGHSLKHLAAAAGTATVLLAACKRRI